MESSYWLCSQNTESQQCSSSTSKKKKIMKSTAGESVDHNPFESLPTEILQKILGYLPVYDRVHVERVCKRWKNVSTKRVWRDVQVLYIVSPEYETKYHKFRESMKKFGKLIAMENNVLFIGIDELGIIKSLISKAGQYVKKITFAVYPDKTITKTVLSIIAAHCHNIECIELDEIEKSAFRVLSKLLRVNEQLRSIRCYEVDNIIELLPLRDWKLLDLDTDGEIEREDWNNRLVELIENSPSLEELCVPHWTQNIIAAISKCGQLKSLNFLYWAEYNKIVDTSLLNRLTCLKLTFFHDEAHSRIDFLRSCINLESLSFNIYPGGIPLEVIQAVSALPKLKSLEIMVSSIIDETLSRSLKVKYLKLNGNACRTITEKVIFKMILNAECLEKLDISKIYVTTELFEELTQNTGERHKVLEIEVSPRIYEAALNICKGSKMHIIEEKLQFLR